MNLAHQLRSLRKQTEALSRSLDSLKPVEPERDPHLSMNPTAHRPAAKRGSKIPGRPFTFTYRAGTTSHWMSGGDPVTEVVYGLNLLDAEINLRQAVRKAGLYMHDIIDRGPV